MSILKNVGPKIVAVIFYATIFASLGLGLSGCGGGGTGEDSAPQLAPVNVTATAADKTPPTVSDTSPANSATGITLNSSVAADFSEAMTNSTLNTASFVVAPTAGGAAIAGTVVAGGNTAMFVPSVNLAPNRQYAATITTAARDSSGNALAANFTWRFSTGAAFDTTPPTVSSTSPANGANAVATNSSVSATFSEAMTNSTLNGTTFSVARTAQGVALSGTVSVVGNTARFVPSSALAPSTQYTATIAAGVTDAAGNALPADFIWTFTTAAAPDTIPPTVSSTSPSNSATGIALNSSVAATFSEAMTNSTLNTTSFTVTPTAGGATLPGTVSVSGNTARFTPSANLAASTQYTAIITIAAKDAAGNALANNYTWNFTTTSGAQGTTYTTSFDLTENPISEGSKWINGKTVGLDWNNVKTDSGRATGSVMLGASRYADDIAILSGPPFAANQYAQATVYLAPGYSPPGNHEVELLLRFSISAHDAHGYEVLWGRVGYLAIVRWNGPVGNYTPLLENVNPGIGVPVDGDVMRAEIIGNRITVYRNGSSVASVDVTVAGGTVYSAGQPGIGFWPVDGATPENYGWKTFEAGGL